MELTESAKKELEKIVAEKSSELPPPTNLRRAAGRSLVIYTRSIRQLRELELISDDIYQRVRREFIDDYLVLRTVPENAEPTAYSESSIFDKKAMELLSHHVEVHRE